MCLFSIARRRFLTQHKLPLRVLETIIILTRVFRRLRIVVYQKSIGLLLFFVLAIAKYQSYSEYESVAEEEIRS